jgi:hypothetical protein
MVLALSLLKIIHMESLDVVTTAVLENFDREFRDLLLAELMRISIKQAVWFLK